MRALSLAVAERCNLGCTYCYAEGGSFGGTPRDMPWEVAEASVRRLFAEASPGERVNLAFLGGEPLVNRSLIRRATEFAAGLAGERKIPIGFSITTNGTLVTAEDGDFFERHGFAVTVSLDGIGEIHDRQRPTKGGRGSYDRVIANVRPLLAQQRRMQVSARVTVTPANLGLRNTLDHFIGLGFHSVGFSPMLSAPTGRGEMQAPDLQVLLDEMIACGREFERRVAAGEAYPFANMMTALEEIHRGTHRPYPCGAGAGYFGVSASGGLFACHRFVEDDARPWDMSARASIGSGNGRGWRERNVDRQEPCRSCWARYLCGGGCHYEVIHRGRPACDYIRGWLDYALGAYVRLLELRPDLFSPEGANAAVPGGAAQPCARSDSDGGRGVMKADEGEICVLGGGPAGSVIARSLAELGHDVLLIDRTARENGPRGESLAPSIVPILDSLRLRSAVDAAVFCREKQALVLWGSADVAVKSFGASPSLLVERAMLDDRLRTAASHAAVRIVSPAKARAVRHLSGGEWLIPVATSDGPMVVKSRFLVDARGKRHRMCIDDGAPRTVALSAPWASGDQRLPRRESRPAMTNGFGAVRFRTVPMLPRFFSNSRALPAFTPTAAGNSTGMFSRARNCSEISCAAK